MVLSPLPIGAVNQWAWATLAVAVGALLCLWAIEVWRGAPVPRLAPFLPALALFAAALLWAAAQAWPGMPASLHHPFWATAANALDVPVAGTISANPAATLQGLVRLMTYAAILFLALVHCRDPSRARAVVASAAAAASVYGAYGLVVFLGGFETILWFPKTAYLGDLTGPMVNRNSFATYCGLGLLCIATLIGRGLARDPPRGLPVRERLRIRLSFFTGRGLLYLGALAALAMALLLTHSRGGFIAFGIGLLVLLGLAAANSRMSFRRAGMAALFVAVGAAALLVTSGEATLIRLFNSSVEAEPRTAAYERTLAAIADSPYLGTGLGTYRDVFQMYRTPSIEKPFFRAHNTYLENALELGIPAAASLTGAVAWLAFACLRGTLRRRRDAAFPCLAVAATALVGSHALVDFSLQIPAVAALYFLILGAGCGQARSSREA